MKKQLVADDGMGGEEAGEVAARIAIEQLAPGSIIGVTLIEE